MRDVLEKESVQKSREIFSKVIDCRVSCVLDMMDLLKQVGVDRQDTLPDGVESFPIYYTADACSMYQVCV